MSPLFSLTSVLVLFNKTSLNNFFSVLVFNSRKGLYLINLRVSSLQNILASSDLSTVLLSLPVNGRLINSCLVLAVFPDYSTEISIQVAILSLIGTTYILEDFFFFSTFYKCRNLLAFFPVPHKSYCCYTGLLSFDEYFSLSFLFVCFLSVGISQYVRHLLSL